MSLWQMWIVLVSFIWLFVLIRELHQRMVHQDEMIEMLAKQFAKLLDIISDAGDKKK